MAEELLETKINNSIDEIWNLFGLGSPINEQDKKDYNKFLELLNKHVELEIELRITNSQLKEMR